MWIDRILESRAANAVELAARFAEQRHGVLAENVANIDTPDYQSRRLDAKAFQASLREAIDTAQKQRNNRLQLRGNRQVWTDASGALHVRPQTEPPQNVLFHDGTNARLEQLMTDAQQNALTYNLAVNLLKGRYTTLLNAIRGRLT